MQMNENDYFVKVPNEYIRCSLADKHGVSNKFFVVYILINRYRTFDNYSVITIDKILELYGIKKTKHKPKAFKEIQEVLRYMVSNNMIEVSRDIDSLNYDTGIFIKINTNNFDAEKNFSKITYSQFYNIFSIDSEKNNKENILVVFLYVNSFIGVRPKDGNGNETIDHPERYPEAFYKSIRSMSDDLSMSKNTICKYLDILSDTNNHLLVKKEINKSFSDISKNKLIPNIYVLNNDRQNQEIEWATNNLIKMYCKNKNNKKSRE
ncbi:MAG: hypothetical protein KBT35_08000 [Firmicutes bacterium]|nr:hypothetical protein [Candidatus Colivicinus equi]